MLEQWREIKGYEGLYEVSTKGNVRGLDRYVTQLTCHGNYMTRLYKGCIVKPRIGKVGYKYLHLSKDGVRTTFKVHRIVAINFINNPHNKPEVNHKDGNKINNDVNNLEWVTSSENKKHAIDLGLKINDFGEAAYAFRGSVEVYNKQGVLIDILSGTRDTISKGYSPCCVSAVLTGRQKTHKNCKFKRKEPNEHT